jgi:hypothetical protein
VNVNADDDELPLIHQNIAHPTAANEIESGATAAEDCERPRLRRKSF